MAFSFSVSCTVVGSAAPLSKFTAHDADVVWLAVYDEFLRWRLDEIHKIAEPHFQSTGPFMATPQYDTQTWWACIIYLRLSKLELVLSRKRSVKNTSPTEIFGIPVQESDRCTTAQDDDRSDTEQSGEHDTCSAVNGDWDTY